MSASGSSLYPHESFPFREGRTSRLFGSLTFHATDLKYLAVLLAVAAVPLIALRELPVSAMSDARWHWVIVCSLVWPSVLWAWCRATAGKATVANATPTAALPGPAFSRLRKGLLVAALLALVATNFFLPLCQHFWGGGDEHIIFTDWPDWMWNWAMDRGMGRPLALLFVGWGDC